MKEKKDLQEGRLIETRTKVEENINKRKEEVEEKLKKNEEKLR